MKKYLLFLIAVLVCVYTYGQGEVEAFRYSQNDLSGTARGQAMGGAFGALGGDPTGVAINPAGIAIYKSSEVVLNAAVTLHNTKIGAGETAENISKTSFTIDNLSYVGNIPLSLKKGGSQLNFGFNYNRVKNYNRKYIARANGMNSSLTDYIADITYGINYDYWDGKDYFQDYESPRWLSILGYNGYLIGNNNGIDDEGKPLYDYASTISGSPDAALDVYEVGNISYYDFALGYSYDDKFYFGATLALATLECRLNGGSYYSETFSNGDGFTLENFLSTEGTGAQIKLGIIYRPIDEIRLGISWHSPTWYSMTDYFSAGILQKNNQYRNVFTPKSTFDYNFRSSGLWTFSWAAVLGSNAIISVDYELKDYGYSRFYDDNYNPSYDNKLIKDGYRWAQTLRTGLEYRFTSQFSGRLGYAWKQSGIKDEIADGQTEIITSGTIPNYTIDGNTTYLTTGIGYKFTPQFYVDFAYVHRIQKDDVYFYSPRFYEPLVASTPVTLKNNVSKYLLTLGYKF